MRILPALSIIAGNANPAVPSTGGGGETRSSISSSVAAVLLVVLVGLVVQVVLAD